MGFFSLNTLWVMGMHGIGALLMMMGILGTPGTLDESKPVVQKIVKVINLLMNASWIGIPILAGASFILILLGLWPWAKAFAWVSIGLGGGLVLSMVILYKNI